MNINDILWHLKQQEYDMKISVNFVGDTVLATTRSSAIWCLYSKYKDMLHLLEDSCIFFHPRTWIGSIQTYLGSHGILGKNSSFRDSSLEFKEKDIAFSWDSILPYQFRPKRPS